MKVLNSRLSEYVRMAASGETVLVTDRGRVVAEIGPPKVTRSPILADALLAEAVRKGRLTPPVPVLCRKASNAETGCTTTRPTRRIGW